MDDLTPGRPQPTTPTPPPATERIPTPSMSRPKPADTWTAYGNVKSRRSLPAATVAKPQSPTTPPSAARLSSIPSTSSAPRRIAASDSFRRVLALLVLVIWPWVLAGWASHLEYYSGVNSHAWTVTLLTTSALAATVAVMLFAANIRLRLLAIAAATAAALALLYLALRTLAWSDQRDLWFDLSALFACPGMLFGALALFATGVLLFHELTRYSLPPPLQPTMPRSTVPGQDPFLGRIAADRAAAIAAEGRYRRRMPVYLSATLPTLALAAWFGYDAIQWNWRSDAATALWLEVVNWLSLAACLSCAAMALYSRSAFWRIGWLAINTALTLQLALLGLGTCYTLSSSMALFWFCIGCAALPCLVCSYTALGWQLESARYPRMLIRPGLQDPVPPDDFQLDSGTWDEAKPRART